MRTADDVLDEAYRILSDEKGWCQGSAMLDALGNEVAYDDDGGVAAVCAWGALVLASDRLGGPFAAALKRVHDTIGTTQLGEWNDWPGRTVEDVLLVLKRARYDVSDEPVTP